MAASTVENGNDRLRTGNRLRRSFALPRKYPGHHDNKPARYSGYPFTSVQTSQKRPAVIYCVCCNKCIVHHIIFCPVNRRLISCRALGSLDTNSGGSTTLLREGSVRREYRLLFFRRLIVVDLGE